MPAVRGTRKPLRERCNIQLNIKTTIPNEVFDDYLFTPDTPSPLPLPSTTSSRRGRPTKRKPLANTSNTNTAHRAGQGLKPSRTKASHVVVPHLLTMYPDFAERDFPCLHCLVPYVYVAFHRGEYLPRSMLAEDGALFTHVVKITYASGRPDDFQPGDIDLQEDPNRGIRLVKLIVPKPPSLRKYYKSSFGKLVLTDRQLLFARDFLALALPYYAETHPHPAIPFDASRRSPDSVRLLITAPDTLRGAEADIMAIATCYLAWASEEPAQTVVEYVRAEDGVPPVWQHAVRGKAAVDLIEMVATAGQ